MKKIMQSLSAVLALLLCFSLAGCGNMPQTPVDSDTPEKDTSSSELVDSSDDAEISELPSEDEPSDTASDTASKDVPHGDGMTDSPPPLRNSYTFDSFSGLAAAYSVKQNGEEAFQKYHGYTGAALNSFDSADKAVEVVDKISTVPIPVLKGEDLSLLFIEYTEDYNVLELVFLNDKTGDFNRFRASFDLSLEKFISEQYNGEELILLCEKKYNDCTISFYKNPDERVTDDIWWTVGLFEVDGMVMTVMFGRDPRIGSKDPDITLDELIAPLEQLTISTILEQIGE